MKKNILISTLVALTFLMSACAPEVKFKVTKPAELQVSNIKSLSVGSFTDELGTTIPLPEEFKNEKKSQSTFVSNKKSSDLVRSLLLSKLSKAGQYKILNSNGETKNFSGTIPDASKVGVLNAKVRYYEKSIEDMDSAFFILLATNNNVPLTVKLAIMAAKETALKMAEEKGKGFNVNVPFVEKVAAMEIDFDLVRKSDGSKVVPTQTFRTYFIQKWGGKGGSAIVSEPLEEVIKKHYLTSKGTVDAIFDKIDQGKLLLEDYEEFVAKGHFLKSNPTVPLLSIDLKNKLAENLVSKYLKKISQYEEDAKLEIASGDSIGVNLMKGNAYEEAINHYENMPKPLDSADLYNMALAYESVGEFHQAQKYYQQGLDAAPGDAGFQKGLDRVK